MNNALMYVSFALGLAAWSALLWMNWARLAHQGFAMLFSVLASVHVFRYIGLIALLPQHLDPAPFHFSHTYLLQVGWGDTAAAALAMIAIVALLKRWESAMLWAWTFVIVGTADTLNAGPQFVLAITDEKLVGALGWLILTIYVPALLVTEATMLTLLVKRLRSHSVLATN